MDTGYKVKVKMPQSIKVISKISLPVVASGPPGVPFSGIRDKVIEGNTITLIDIII